MGSVLITTLARYQTDFWIPVARQLQELGHSPSFLTFDDPSHGLISKEGFRSFNAFDLGVHAVSASTEALERELLEVLGWTLPLAASHERITFRIHDMRTLAQKLSRHRAAAEQALSVCAEAGDATVVVQELGGFLSVIGTFLAARVRSVDNLFLEPSFFKGRFFVTRNSFAAPRIDVSSTPAVEPEALKQLDAARSARSIVIPAKDRHHYSAAVRKVANARNARRLVAKLYEKYGRGQRHEFGYMGSHVSGHLRMVRNSVRLRAAYKPLDAAGRMIYYPLHVPADAALTLRAPHYLDQLSLVDFLARVIPATHRLAIKEHPAQVGALDADRLLELAERHDNLDILRPSTNNYDVLGACELVVSINSKAGAEALLMDKPVLVLGDAFYGNSGLVTRVPSLADLPQAIRSALANPARNDLAAVEQFFSRVWCATHPGELYVAEQQNARTFANSLNVAMEA